MEPLSFSGPFVQKVVVICFSDSFVQKTTQQWDGSCNATSGSLVLVKVFRQQPFLFCKCMRKINYEQRILHCTPRCQNSKMRFLPNCRYHISFLANVEEVLHKLDPLCFTYQRVDCIYTLFKYRFNGNIVDKSGQLFGNVQRAVYFNQRNSDVDRMPSIAKNRLLRINYWKHSLSFFQKTKLNANQWISLCRKKSTSQKDKVWIGIF